MEARQTFTSSHNSDEHGNPAGGKSECIGAVINWQDGPTKVNGQEIPQNGAFVETVIAMTIDRLNYFQDSKYKCIENDAAINCLKAALETLDHRTQTRIKRGVEGTHTV